VRSLETSQFKKDAVRLVVEEGKSLTEVAAHLGIARSLLQRWREQLSSKPAPEVFPGHGRVTGQAAKLREFEKKLRDVTMERDILRNAGLLCGRTEVKSRFIQEQRETFPVGQLCRVLEVSRSGFYSWSKRPWSERDRQNAALLQRIHAVHRENRGVYGSPRVYRALRAAGHRAGRHRVARLMRLEGLRGRAVGAFASSPPVAAISPRLPTSCW
jgi:putative transposase